MHRSFVWLEREAGLYFLQEINRGLFIKKSLKFPFFLPYLSKEYRPGDRKYKSEGGSRDKSGVLRGRVWISLETGGEFRSVKTKQVV